jgi:hypothetical protein
MRIFFIHGFGETPAIFEHIAPAIGGQQVFINLWEELGTEKQQKLNVFDFAKKLVQKNTISNHDWVIGHSLGGWIAYYMKQLCGCHIVQIASFTDFNKVNLPIRSPKTAYWLVNKGLFFNHFMKWLYDLPYRGLPSRQVNKEIFARLIAAGRQAVVNQLQLMYEPVTSISLVPDLRIHALKDTIVKPPAESFCQVPGDHYCLVTHPAAVTTPILDLLGKA